MSFVSFVDGGEHGLVDPEAHGGGHQGQGQVAEHAEHNHGGKYQAENRRKTSRRKPATSDFSLLKWAL